MPPGFKPVSFSRKQLEMMAKMKTKNSEKLMKHCKMRISNNHVTYVAEMFALAIHSYKMKQNVGLFFFCSS